MDTVLVLSVLINLQVIIWIEKLFTRDVVLTCFSSYTSNLFLLLWLLFLSITNIFIIIVISEGTRYTATFVKVKILPRVFHLLSSEIAISLDRRDCSIATEAR